MRSDYLGGSMYMNTPSDTFVDWSTIVPLDSKHCGQPTSVLTLVPTCGTPPMVIGSKIE